MEEKEITNNELAALINKGFDGVQGQFDELKEKVNRMDEKFEEKFDYVDARLGRLENGFKEIKNDLVKRYEFEDALARIKLLERKVGIESGK